MIRDQPRLTIRMLYKTVRKSRKNEIPVRIHIWSSSGLHVAVKQRSDKVERPRRVVISNFETDEISRRRNRSLTNQICVSSRYVGARRSWTVLSTSCADGYVVNLTRKQYSDDWSRRPTRDRDINGSVRRGRCRLAAGARHSRKADIPIGRRAYSWPQYVGPRHGETLLEPSRTAAIGWRPIRDDMRTRGGQLSGFKNAQPGATSRGYLTRAFIFYRGIKYRYANTSSISLSWHGIELS